MGGRIDERVRNAKVPPLDLEYVLAPFRRPVDLPSIEAFVAHRPLHIEIGFGRPHHLCDLAAAKPDTHVLGFEIRRRWVRAASRRATREGLANLRAVEGDARPYIERLVAPGTVDAFHILFPDPWWKKRHHKRRIFQPAFVGTMHQALTDSGTLIVKTDVEAYADMVADQLLDLGGWSLDGTSYADPMLGALPPSHREKKCRELGINVYCFRFTKVSQP